jgi:topoisomerase (DNA) II binding protein 1
VICTSNYIGPDRHHIGFVAAALGMLAQEDFAKRDKEKDGKVTKQSTHLVCATPEGNKYNAAIKWKLPVVR